MPDRMSERQFRWVELALAALFSCVGGVFTTAFIVRGYISQIEQNTKDIASNKASITTMVSSDANQNTQLAVMQAQYGNIMSTLQDIKNRLDRK